MENVQNVGAVGNQVKGRRKTQEFIVVRYWKKIINSKVFRQRNSIELDRTLIVKAKILSTWSHVKGVDYKGVGSYLVLLQRVSNYITSIEKRKPSCKIEQHFTRPGHTINDYSVLRIVKLDNPPRDPTGRLREFGGYWMIKLNMLEPFGLSGIHEYERITRKQGLKVMFEEEISIEF